MMSIKQLYL